MKSDLCTIAKDDFSFYCEIVYRRKYKVAKHNAYICQALERVERGEVPRLMICMPPRHSKSMTVTETFPSWYIGRNPDRRVIEVSYGADLATRFGRENRRKIEEFGKWMFGIEIAPDNGSATNWTIKGHKGGMLSAGVGGPISGAGAELLLIDDPIKNREEANSITYRDRLWDEWQNTLLTRLQAGGAVILILTRWHVDDLAGRILASTQDVGWEIISLPAEAEENDPLGRAIGDPLWPEGGFDQEWMVLKKAEIGSLAFAALYQQRPTPQEGGLFRRAWFEIVEGYPSDSRFLRFWDFAATDQDGDWTAGCKLAEKDGIGYIIDMRRIQGTPHEVERLVKQIADIDGKLVPIRWEEEGGSSGKMISDHYQRRILFGMNAKGIRSTGPKVARAGPLAAMAEAGNIKLVRGSWNETFLEEIETFPYGAHDDQVDAASSALAAIRSVGGGAKPDMMKAAGYNPLTR